MNSYFKLGTLSAILLSLSAASYARDIEVIVKVKKTVSDPLTRSEKNVDPQLAARQLQTSGLQLATLFELPDPARDWRMTKTDSLKTVEAMQRHNLDRYFQISKPPATEREAQALVEKLKQNPLVETAYVRPEAVSIGEPPLPEESAATRSVPNYADCDATPISSCQYYLYPDIAKSPYRMGGLNVVEAHKRYANKGELSRIVSVEINHWNYDHPNLPKPFLKHWDTSQHKVDSHDTSSAGVMFSKDNGIGTIGIAARAQAGYSKYGAGPQLLDLAKQLKAGDVVQVGIHYSYVNGLPEYGCKINCYMPVEQAEDVFDAISYMTAEKGIHVVIAAANGNINLDHPNLKRKYDRKIRDSGAIYAGAADPKDAKRASFSQYGGRVDLFSWGRNVTSTSWSAQNPNGYTTTYSGTSSANPIIAGSVALLQSIARANNLGDIPPKKMRDILVRSGQPLRYPDPAAPIGMQPDLVKAADIMLQDAGGGWQPAPVAVISGDNDVPAGSQVTLSAAKSTGDNLKYAWSIQPALPLNTNGSEVSFSIPNLQKDTQYLVKLKITDAKNRTSEDSMELWARGQENGVLPDINIHGDKEVIAGDVEEGAIIEADMPAGKKLRFEWKNTSGLTLHPNFNQLLIFADKGVPSRTHTIHLEVFDGAKKIGKGRHTITVKDENTGALPPKAVISGGSNLEEGSATGIMLSAQASTGTGLSYQWANNSGLTLLPNQDRAIVSAPQGVKAGKHEIMLTVTDNKGQTAQASHAITVKAMENGVVLPQANITGGTELTIAAAQGLVLSGKSSSGSQLRFTWSNASGLGLQANGDQVLVRAPQNTKPGNHEVKLLVTDNKGNTAQSTHALRVKAAETGGTEGDIADYRPGVSYKAGDKVKNVGKVFQCKPMPYSAWCGQSAAHYAPGTGSAWGQAWTQIK